MRYTGNHRKAALVVLCICYAGAVLAAAVPASAEDCAAEIDEDTALSLYQGNVAAFLDVFDEIPLDTIRLRAVERERRASHTRVEFRLNETERQRRALARVDVATGMVVSFIRSWVDLDAAHASITDAISEKDAFESATSILRYYGLSTDLEDYERSGPRDGAGAQGLLAVDWRFCRSFDFEGLPCRGSGIWVSIDAFSGFVRSVTYVPVVEPEPVLQPISRQEALQACQRYLEDCHYFSRWKCDVVEDASERIKAVIAFPRVFQQMESLPESILAHQSYYCWEVPFHDRTFLFHQMESVLWLTMESGLVIGYGGSPR